VHVLHSISCILGVILVYPYWLHSGFRCTICQMCVCHWTWCHAFEMCWSGKLNCCPLVKAWLHQWLSDGIFLSRICLSRQQLYSVLKAWSLYCVHSFCLPTSWLHTSNLKVSSFATFFFLLQILFWVWNCSKTVMGMISFVIDSVNHESIVYLRRPRMLWWHDILGR